MPDDNTLSYINQTATNLLSDLANYAAPVANKYAYYNGDQATKDFGISLPKGFTSFRPGVGWATRAVNTLGDRLNFDGFANDRIGANEMFKNAGADAVLAKAKTDALIAGCSFIATVKADGETHLMPFTAMEATGIIDENTGRLKYGLAVTDWYGYEQNKYPNMWSKLGLVPKNYILFLKDCTAFFENGSLVEVVENPTKRPQLHVITHRQSADKPLGKARISNTVRRIVDEVSRLKLRYEVAAEFYSTPQRYITGAAQGALNGANFESALGKIWAITKDEDGDKAEIGQLAQMTISQFSEQKKDLARDFCAETALTLRNLGYETSNPTSAESLSAMSDDLLLEAQECQQEMGEQFKEIAISMGMLRANSSTYPADWNEARPSWKPVFQLDLGAAGDALYKLFEIMPELKGTMTAYRMLGMSITEAEEVAKNQIRSTNGFMPTEEQ